MIFREMQEIGKPLYVDFLIVVVAIKRWSVQCKYSNTINIEQHCMMFISTSIGRIKKFRSAQNESYWVIPKNTRWDHWILIWKECNNCFRRACTTLEYIFCNRMANFMNSGNCHILRATFFVSCSPARVWKRTLVWTYEIWIIHWSRSFPVRDVFKFYVKTYFCGCSRLVLIFSYWGKVYILTNQVNTPFMSIQKTDPRTSVAVLDIFFSIVGLGVNDGECQFGRYGFVGNTLSGGAPYQYPMLCEWRPSSPKYAVSNLDTSWGNKSSRLKFAIYSESCARRTLHWFLSFLSCFNQHSAWFMTMGEWIDEEIFVVSLVRVEGTPVAI